MDTNTLYDKDSSNEDSPSSQEHSFYPPILPHLFLGGGFGKHGITPHSPYLFYNHYF